MSRSGELRVAVVGLVFGAAFLPIYLEHPGVGEVVICDNRLEVLEQVGARYGISGRYAGLDDVLADEGVDAIHVVSPVSTHAEFSVRALLAGKHCACAVPMATSDEDVFRVLDAERTSGRRYMMMETMVYSRAYLYVKSLYDQGELGELTFLRGAHIQDLEGFARCWWGYPPMHYATHVVAPLLEIAGTRAESVTCLGSGHLPEHVRGDYANPFPLESALFRLARSDLAAEVTMAFFQTARPYVEGFTIYGDRRGFEWPQLEGESALLYELQPVEVGRRGRRVTTTPLDPPDRPELLPPAIARFTTATTYQPPRGQFGPVEVLAHHGSSHPHLVHEFVSAIIDDRPARVSAAAAARWTQPGIAAHRSALAGGAVVPVPSPEPDGEP